MAKNKNRKGGSQNRAPQAEQAHEHAQRSSTEAHESPAHVPGSPSDVARKKQKSFGHN
ncbi:hypothetical protein [Streptomyces diastatochromogenes]|uniref:hypothetical protein n=1 Tax=Streptomyces diastatochromogenes TaxID=42236 RepID=UPI00142E161E|nr:hypothetical protein [Streptomyces diastatochromogenes]MCZ0989694.1 hypothetical protein [Streptomyces diastatochromogenes]